MICCTYDNGLHFTLVALFFIWYGSFAAPGNKMFPVLRMVQILLLLSKLHQPHIMK